MSRFGPRITRDIVAFRLWAPDAKDVALEIRDRDLVPMRKMPGGWFEAEAACEPGTCYRFRLGDIAFADPASRLQSGGVHGWSVLTAPPSHISHWRGRPWEESVLYECHVGLMGGFDGVTAQLPRLADLGITVLELMPVAAFPGQRNWGYDGVLLFAPAEAYGEPHALRRLIEKAHELRLSVVLDVVYNHFGPDGNFLSLYASRFFRDDVQTPWGAAIDFRQPEVREFFFENACYWLEEFGFDGLRLDAIHAIRDEGWLVELPPRLKGKFPDRDIKLIVENEDNDAALLAAGYEGQWNDDFHHALHVLLTDESHSYYGDYRERPAAKLAKALSEGFIYQGDISSVRGAPRGKPSGHLRPASFINFLQNHDQIGNRPFGDRLTESVAQEKLRAAVALLMLCPQIPMLFMGEEIGTTTPFLYFTDHNPELAQQVREGRRREFAHFAQHADIPDANDLATYLQSKPVGVDGEFWSGFYRYLIGLRARHVAPHRKGARAIEAAAISVSAVCATWRLGDGSKLTLATNLGNGSVAHTFPGARPFFGQLAGHNCLPAFATVAWIEG